MTIDIIPLDSPNGNVLSDSLIGCDEEEEPQNLTSLDTNRVPLIRLKKLEDYDLCYKIVSPKSSNRQRKLKSFDDFEMELSPKKRERRPKANSDIEMLSPIKRQKTPMKPHYKTDNIEDNIDSLCSPLKNTVQLTSPVKKWLNKTVLSDEVEIIENELSPRKNEEQQSTGDKNTPKGLRGRTKKNCNESPIKVDENKLILSGRRQRKTPVKYADNISPLKSVKKNLNESFRRSILKSKLDNVAGSETRDSIAKQPTPTTKNSSVKRSPVKFSGVTKRGTCPSYASFYYDSDSDDNESTLPRKQTVAAKKRILRSRNKSVSSHTSEVSSKNGTESDEDKVPIRNGKRSRLKSRSNPDYSDTETDDEEDIPLSKRLQPNTPSRRKQILRPRKDSTTSNDASGDKWEESPARRPPRNVAKTPKTPRNGKAAASTPKSVPGTPKTPKNRLKLLREGVITPSMHSRTSIIPGDSTPLMKARSQLHVSYVPTSLPCRAKEYLEVYNFLRGKLDDGCGGCMYISGVPGTGKTATVTSVIDNLQNDRKIPKFSYVSVNGMRLSEPRQSYVEIWKQLTGKTVPWEQAQSLLEERFTKKKHMTPVVMLIDELDILCTKRQDVVYNLLDWPTKSKDQLMVITIANTMDLPERLLMSRVTSRLGLTRLTFQAYTHKQLMEIVTTRLTGTDSFNPDAIQLVARKVASVSGDARRALDICRRAAEIAETEGKAQLVNIMHINEALNAMITQPQVMAIKRCSRLQQLLLQAIVAEIERTGVEETTFNDVFRLLVSCCALDGFKMVSSTVAQRAIYDLSAYRLIITDQKCSNQGIILNVSVHDVYFALRKE